MNILALDMAMYNTGWALGDGVFTDFGTAHFASEKNTSTGLVLLRADTWIRRKITDYSLRPCVDMLVYERGFHRGARSDLLTGLGNTVERVGAEYRIEVVPVRPKALKKFATGRGDAGKSDMIEAARATWEHPKSTPITDDEADALLLLDYALRQEVKS